MDMFMQILAMLFPAGLGSIITWMFSRNLYRAKKKKEVHDIYQVMYNDVCTTLTHIKDENRKLYQIVERFEKAVLKATDCFYWDDCPMRHELQESAELASTVRLSGRQSPVKKKGGTGTHARAAKPGKNQTDNTTD